MICCWVFVLFGGWFFLVGWMCCGLFIVGSCCWFGWSEMLLWIVVLRCFWFCWCGWRWMVFFVVVGVVVWRVGGRWFWSLFWIGGLVGWCYSVIVLWYGGICGRGVGRCWWSSWLVWCVWCCGFWCWVGYWWLWLMRLGLIGLLVLVGWWFGRCVVWVLVSGWFEGFWCWGGSGVWWCWVDCYWLLLRCWIGFVLVWLVGCLICWFVFCFW